MMYNICIGGDEMKANFLKRVLAFCFDYFILTLVLSFITVGFNTSNESFYTEISNISKEYNEGNISVNEYNDKLMELEYEYQKDNLPVNIINIVLFFAGCKKMMKILNTELNKKYSKTTVFLVYLVFLFNFISIVIH